MHSTFSKNFESMQKTALNLLKIQ